MDYLLTILCLLIPLVSGPYRPEKSPAPLRQYLDFVRDNMLHRPGALLEQQGDHPDIRFLNRLFLNAWFQGRCTLKVLPEIRRNISNSARALEVAGRVSKILGYRSLAILILCLAGRYILARWQYVPVKDTGGLATSPWLPLVSVVIMFFCYHELLRRSFPDPWFFQRELSPLAKKYCHILIMGQAPGQPDTGTCEFRRLEQSHQSNGSDHSQDLASLLQSRMQDMEEQDALKIRQWEEYLPIAEFSFLLISSAILLARPLLSFITVPGLTP